MAICNVDKAYQAYIKDRALKNISTKDEIYIKNMIARYQNEVSSQTMKLVNESESTQAGTVPEPPVKNHNERDKKVFVANDKVVTGSAQKAVSAQKKGTGIFTGKWTKSPIGKNIVISDKYNFSNPFATAEEYGNWILNRYEPEDLSPAEKKDLTNKRAYIVSNIRMGKLDVVPIYKTSGTNDEYTHADVLSNIVEHRLELFEDNALSGPETVKKGEFKIDDLGNKDRNAVFDEIAAFYDEAYHNPEKVFTVSYGKALPSNSGLWNASNLAKMFQSTATIPANVRFTEPFLHKIMIQEEISGNKKTFNQFKYKKKSVGFDPKPYAKPDLQKAVFKASKATAYIGYGNENSSTKHYAAEAEKNNIPVNKDTYTKDDVVFVSINRVPTKESAKNTLENVLIALESGSIVLADSKEYLSRSKANKGEKWLASELAKRKYAYATSRGNKNVGIWKKQSEPVKPRELNTKIVQQPIEDEIFIEQADNYGKFDTKYAQEHYVNMTDVIKNKNTTTVKLDDFPYSLTFDNKTGIAKRQFNKKMAIFKTDIDSLKMRYEPVEIVTGEGNGFKKINTKDINGYVINGFAKEYKSDNPKMKGINTLLVFDTDKNKWYIIEKSTLLGISGTKNTREEAIAGLNDALKNKTNEQIKNLIKTALSKNNNEKSSQGSSQNIGNKFEDGDTIKLFSQIDIGDNKHITYNFNPEGQNSNGPVMPGKIGSDVDIEVTGQYEDENMKYRTVKITVDGKTYDKQPSGTPLHITDWINKDNGIKPFMTGQHANNNPDLVEPASGHLTGSVSVVNGKYNSRFDKSIKRGSTSNSDLFGDNDTTIIAEREVNLGDADVFNSILEQARQDDFETHTYNVDGIDRVEPSLMIGSPDFKMVHDNVVNLFTNALANAKNSKVTYRELETSMANLETAGLITQKGNKTQIDIRWNKFKANARKEEVILHEILHMLTNKAFKDNVEIQNILHQFMDQARSKINENIFLNSMLRKSGVRTTDGAREVIEENRQIASDMYEYVFGENADPEEFFAYAVTNEDVFEAIKDLKIEPEFISKWEGGSNGKIKGSKFIDFINMIIGIINKVITRMTNTGTGGADLIMNSLYKLIRQQYEMEKEDNSDYNTNKFVDKIDKVDGKMKDWIDTFEAKISDVDKDIKKKVPFGKIEKKLDKIAGVNRVLRGHMFQNIALQSFEDTTDHSVSSIYELYRQGKRLTEAKNVQLADSIKAEVNRRFEGVDKETRKAITSMVFQIDLPSLRTAGNLSMKDISELLVHDDVLNEAYNTAKEKVKELYTKYGTEYSDMFGTSLDEFNSDMKQMEALATYMNTGKATEHNLQLNAENIYNKFYKLDGQLINNRYTSEHKDTIVAAMNHFITLAAIKKAPKPDRNIVYSYLQHEENQQHIEGFMNMYQRYVEATADEMGIGKFNSIPKGFLAYPNVKKMKFELVSEDELGYTTGFIGNMHRIDDKPYMTINGEKYYRVVGRSHDLGFDEGMFSIAGQRVEGISLKQILINRLSSSNKKRPKNKRYSANKIDDIVSEKIASIDMNGLESIGIDVNEDNKFVPIYDPRGNIMDYKIQMGKQEQVASLGVSTDIADVASYTFSKMMHRQAAMKHNQEVADMLLQYAQDNAPEHPEDFIIIEKHDPKKGPFDEDINGRWNRIPDYTRNYIFQKTGQQRLVIPKSKIELITGEKRASFSNAHFGPFSMMDHPRLQKFVKMLEDYIGEITGYVKEGIAIKMGSVVLANTVSNYWQAWVESGIGPFDYIIAVRAKWLELNIYREDSRKLANAEVAYIAATSEMEANKYKTQIKVLKAKLAKNGFHDLIEDGQFSPFIEDVNVDENHGGHISQYIEDKMNNNAFLHSIKPIKEFIFMDRNTKLYQGMLKVTQYGDIITREILREEKVKKMKKAGISFTGKDYQDYLNYLDQLFVNYSYINNRFLKYADRIFGIFFLKYYFNQAKAWLKMAKRAPARITSLLGFENLTGIDWKTADDDYWHSFESLMYRITGQSYYDIGVEVVRPDIMDFWPGMNAVYV